MPLVFDIQRFCVNDGPGIRSTVFLKGCPLSCPWCHNPESNSYRPQLSFRASACVACGACAAACPHGVHELDAITGKHTVHFDRCRACGACVRACPTGALGIYGREMSVDEVIGTFARDEDFYAESGGGITISGGEAMSRLSDTLSIAEASKWRGWHVCVETSGFGKPEHYGQAAQVVDLFLFDYKVSGPGEYERLIGISEERVLGNLAAIGRAGGRVVLRCPIVPGINDVQGHFEAIAGLSQLAQVDHVELLPYHDFGVGKAKSIGSSQFLEGVAVPHDEDVQRWIGAIEDAGGVDIRKA